MNSAYSSFYEANRQIAESMNAYKEMVRRIEESTAGYQSVADSVNATAGIASGTVLQDAHALMEKLDKSTAYTMEELIRDRLGATHLTSLVSTLNNLDHTNRGFIERVSQSRLDLANSIPRVATALASQQAALRRSSASHYISSQQAVLSVRKSLDAQNRLLRLTKTSPSFLADSNRLLSSNLLEGISSLTTSYQNAIESIPDLLSPQSAFIAKYTPAEYLSGIEVLEKIYTESDEEAEAEELPSVDEELTSFDEQLLNMLNGARSSLRSDNPDKARHVTTSVRELFTHVLHRLAPDKAILQWTEDSSHYHNGRPTRRTRLLYICRQFSDDPMKKFVEADVAAALALIDALNAGTHGVTSKLTEFHLQAIICRMESLILYLLRVSQESFE